MTPVAALFVRSDSIYKTLPGVDCYDMERDARTYDGPHPVVAHPPCRAWGRLSHFANPRPDERNLGRLAVALVREFGGVLEHPAHSSLWRAARMPFPGTGMDDFGGWTLPVLQWWWGHRAAKATWLYIVGTAAADLPAIPYRMGTPDFAVGSSGRRKDGTRSGRAREIKKSEREHTPPLLAEWLVELARRCRVPERIEA